MLDATVAAVESTKAVDKKADAANAAMKAIDGADADKIKAMEAKTESAEKVADEEGKAVLQIKKESTAIQANAEDGEESSHKRVAAMAKRLMKVATAMARKANAAKQVAEKKKSSAEAPQTLDLGEARLVTPEAAFPGKIDLAKQKKAMWSLKVAAKKAVARSLAIQRLKKADATYVNKLGEETQLGGGQQRLQSFSDVPVSTADQLANKAIARALHQHDKLDKARE